MPDWRAAWSSSHRRCRRPSKLLRARRGAAAATPSATCISGSSPSESAKLAGIAWKSAVTRPAATEPGCAARVLCHRRGSRVCVTADGRTCARQKPQTERINRCRLPIMETSHRAERRVIPVREMADCFGCGRPLITLGFRSADESATAISHAAGGGAGYAGRRGNGWAGRVRGASVAGTCSSRTATRRTTGYGSVLYARQHYGHSRPRYPIAAKASHLRKSTGSGPECAVRSSHGRQRFEIDV
jgi:hypothetical protein